MDWSLFHAVNEGVATRDWLEDPTTALSAFMAILYAAVTCGLWFLARPYGDPKWKLACVSGLTAAGVAMLTNQAISHLWERPRPFTAHPALTHLLSAPSPDPSFPSDHAAAAFAIAFVILAFSRGGGVCFLVFASLIGLTRIGLGLHYPSDVVAGMVVGWAAAWIVTGFAMGWISRIVVMLSRLSDPLLVPLWRQIAARGTTQR